jgi:hypothetical protein
MSATPRPYPVLARLRYDYREGDGPLNVVENAWWESRPDGGCVLGAVVEAMGHPRTPYRLRIHLRLAPDFTPRLMEATLLRPDGEGRAAYHFEAERVQVEGEWNGSPVEAESSMPHGYTVAPHCLAADGLHFRDPRNGVRTCYLLDPRREDGPLVGKPAAFTSYYVKEETIEVSGAAYSASRFRAAYESLPDRPADFWVWDRRFALRMTSSRSNGQPVEIVATDLRFPSNEGKGIDSPLFQAI